jgi:N-glycosidase YbiA
MQVELQIVGTGQSAVRTREVMARLGYVESPERLGTMLRPARVARRVQVICSGHAELLDPEDMTEVETRLQSGGQDLVVVRSFVRPGALALLEGRFATPVAYWPDLPARGNDMMLIGVGPGEADHVDAIFGIELGQEGLRLKITSVEAAENACFLAHYRDIVFKAVANETHKILGEAARRAAIHTLDALGFHHFASWGQSVEPARMSDVTSTAEDREVFPYLLYGASRSLSLHGPLAGEVAQAGDPVFFHDVNETHGYFSNFSNHAVHMRSQIWPTMEHYYQGSKFQLPVLVEEVRTSLTPGAAKRYAHRHAADIRPDWSETKVTVMRAGLIAKFSQHIDLRERLIATGGAELVEVSPCDVYWGRTVGGHGRNMLGQLLMSVREELKGG